MGIYKDKIQAAIDGLIDSQVEYAETHQDAASDLCSLISEGIWEYENCDEKLAQFCADSGIPMFEHSPEYIGQLVLDNLTMESRHMLASVRDDKFCVYGFPVGEVEVQITLDQLRTMTGLNVTAKRLQAMGYDIGVNHTEMISYGISDMVWYAVIDGDTIAQLIAENSEMMELAAEYGIEPWEIRTKYLGEFLSAADMGAQVKADALSMTLSRHTVGGQTWGFSEVPAHNESSWHFGKGLTRKSLQAMDEKQYGEYMLRIGYVINLNGHYFRH